MLSERNKLVCKSSTDFPFSCFFPESRGKACRRSFEEEIARFIIALQKKMALCSSTQKKMKAIDEMGLQSMLPGCLQKISKKSLENPNLHLMTTFSPFLVTLCYPIKLFFASLKCLKFPMGLVALKESPSVKKVWNPELHFHGLKPLFWTTRKVGIFVAQWMEFQQN